MKSLILRVLLALACQVLHGTTYYIDSSSGFDSNDGQSEQSAWKSLDRLSLVKLLPGDAILLKRGSRLNGALKIKHSGSKDQPITVSSYGTGVLPVIDATGYRAGIHIVSASHIRVEDLEITGDGGKMVDGSSGKERAGVLVSTWNDKPVSYITLRNLYLHDLFPPEGSPHEGRKENTHLGYGVIIHGNRASASSHFVIQGCRIERVGFKAIELKHISKAGVLNNHMKDIGGPAIQPGNVEDLLVRGNVVDGSGSSIDPRMHGRGSGIWPWTSRGILIEKNTFMGARGKADSCGIHIDFNSREVIVQYNLSIDNEGGFVEILGNCHNSIYRYNISINDGARVKGANDAHQEGKILWTSGFVGRKKKKVGPFNSYIYNNTIYTAPDSRSCFSITGTTEGLLVANNIFHLMGTTRDVLGDQDWRKDKIVDRIKNPVVTSNVVLRTHLLPESLPFESVNQQVGDADFPNPGGLSPEDYVPGNRSLVQDRGHQLQPLPEDNVWTTDFLRVETDFLGNPVTGKPDIGAIEIPL